MVLAFHSGQFHYFLPCIIAEEFIRCKADAAVHQFLLFLPGYFILFLLGAAALGDIGKHFPDTDPAYAGADSLQLAQHVARIMREKGWKIVNIDSTLLCQKPKLAPYIPAMRENLAAAFGMPVDAVSVKATTEEHLGFTGEGLGIAAHAVALIEKL